MTTKNSLGGSLASSLAGFQALLCLEVARLAHKAVCLKSQQWGGARSQEQCWLMLDRTGLWVGESGVSVFRSNVGLLGC